jgi:hypothetical protein
MSESRGYELTTYVTCIYALLLLVRIHDDSSYLDASSRGSPGSFPAFNSVQQNAVFKTHQFNGIIGSKQFTPLWCAVTE